MKRSSARSGHTTLAGWLLVLLLGPLAVPEHLHAEDHDGSAPHAEAPHHEHHVQRTAEEDQVPSGQFKIVIAVGVPGTSVGLTDAPVERERLDRFAEIAPARGPPPTNRSRAPPVTL